jgi:murein DD-endopeptidase MepM/ murein hydrolase activator NlpD
MNPPLPILRLLALLLLCIPAGGQTQPLGIEKTTDGIRLKPSASTNPATFFVYQSTNIQNLATSPELLLTTNAFPVAGILIPSLCDSQFFNVAQWPNSDPADFGHAYEPDIVESPPISVISASIPEPLIGGEAFDASVFIVDQNGQLLDYSGPIEISVIHLRDQSRHPSAVVLPTSGIADHGSFSARFTVSDAESLADFTLSVRLLDLAQLSLDKPKTGFGPPHNRTASAPFLRNTFNLPNAGSITPATYAELQAILEQRRAEFADSDTTWSFPLDTDPRNVPVAGTFGEWRGKASNEHVHRGLDLAAEKNVLASRGGVVSARSSHLGEYLVIDHGDGYFSRYLHLDPSSVVVKLGQGVERGAVLATRLYVTPDFGKHLHFEIRKSSSRVPWGRGEPGSAEDPLSAPGAFKPKRGILLPDLEEIGLTHEHPAKIAFEKKAPTTVDSIKSDVFIVARVVDKEPKPGIADPNLANHFDYYRLSVVASLRPEGTNRFFPIWPKNDDEISKLLPKTAPSDAIMGFGRYGPKDPLPPHRTSQYRYWWQWNTEPYRDKPAGPRTFQIAALDYDSAFTNVVFTFGPKILEVRRLNSGNHFSVKIEPHLGSSNQPSLIQPDLYKWEVIKGGLVRSFGFFDRTFDKHKEPSENEFQYPGDCIGGSGWLLRISSVLAPDIAHTNSLPGFWFEPASIDLEAGSTAEVKLFECTPEGSKREYDLRQLGIAVVRSNGYKEYGPQAYTDLSRTPVGIMEDGKVTGVLQGDYSVVFYPHLGFDQFEIAYPAVLKVKVRRSLLFVTVSNPFNAVSLGVQMNGRSLGTAASAGNPLGHILLGGGSAFFYDIPASGTADISFVGSGDREVSWAVTFLGTDQFNQFLGTWSSGVPSPVYSYPMQRWQ